MNKNYPLFILIAFAVLAGLATGHVWQMAVDQGGMHNLRTTTTAAAKLIETKTIDGPAMGMAALSGVDEPILRREALGGLPPDAPAVLARLRAVRRLAKAKGVYLIDRKGRVVARTARSDVALGGKNLASKPYWKRAVDGHRTVYTSVDATGGGRNLYVAAPLFSGTRGKGGRVIGVVVVQKSADFLDKDLLSFGSGAVLISPHGTVFASSRPAWLYRMTKAPAHHGDDTVGTPGRPSKVSTEDPPPALPFHPADSYFHWDGRRYAQARSSVDWGDPAGHWTLAVVQNTGQWLPGYQRNIVGLFGGMGAFLLGGFLIQRRSNRAQTAQYRTDLLATSKAHNRDMKVSQEKLAMLVENGILLGREQDRHKLLRHILGGAQSLSNCAIGTIFLKTEHDTLSFAIRTNSDELPDFELPLHDPKTGTPNDMYVSVWSVIHNRSAIIDDVYTETRFDLSGTKKFSEESGFRTISMLTVPLSPREGEVMGALQLLNALDPETGAIVPFSRDIVHMVEALAAQSAVALENHQLLDAQRKLMDSMIQLIAGAIDAKSPYTGGHCERVPELALMLADEAGKVEDGPLADFRFKSDEEWREFRIGAWLHDCGKVITPEYVVDKATKLETIYNRIHEVRTRFEILLRDARIEQLEAVAAGADAETAGRAYEARKAQLIDDFAFIAECNLGGEFMAPERVERLQQIADQTWWRHFDDRLGLSDNELELYEGTSAAELPVEEHLLADKPHHIVPRCENKSFDPKYGFKLKVPENLYDRGELHNLSIGRGTLTDEERFKINEHIVQTIVMLENMPFPENLKRVPEYAGSHHETLIGTGYPRGLNKDELSVPSRIMAIADIFEALTAADRPYKKAKTLSEAVKILSFFKKDQHIDPDLFDLFLKSGTYARYAEKYLLPEQIDDVDVERYLG